MHSDDDCTQIVTAFAFFGTLTANPATDALRDRDGNEFRFEPPKGDELPRNGFQQIAYSYIAPTDDPNITVKIDPKSQRLERYPPQLFFRPLTIL